MTNPFSKIAAHADATAARKARRAVKKAENEALTFICNGPAAHQDARGGVLYPEIVRQHVRTVVRGRKKPKRAKSPSLSKLKKLLWAVQREVVYAMSPDACMSCGEASDPVACHIVPSNDGAIIRFFLPNLYRGCNACNNAERLRRGRWRGKFEELFGKDFVDALYLMSEEDNAKPISEKFQLKKWWLIEQTQRMTKILMGAAS